MTLLLSHRNIGAMRKCSFSSPRYRQVTVIDKYAWARKNGKHAIFSCHQGKPTWGFDVYGCVMSII